MIIPPDQIIFEKKPRRYRAVLDRKIKRHTLRLIDDEPKNPSY